MSDHGKSKGAWGASEMSHQEVRDELMSLVDQGLLNMGVSDEGDCVFWPTDEGIIALEMDVIPAAPTS